MRTPIILPLILCILFGCIAASCRGGMDDFDARLSDVEEMMETNPDSAYRMLQDGSMVELMHRGSKRQYALFCLLLVKSKLAESKEIHDTYHLSMALGYFEEEGPSVNYAEALLLNSYFFRSQGGYAFAVVPAMQAYRMAEFLNDLRLKAKASEELAAIYRDTHHPVDAEKYSRFASESYGKTGDGHALLVSKAKLAFDCVHSYWPSECGELLSEIDSVGVDSDELKSLVAEAYMLMYMSNGEYEKVEAYGDTVLMYGPILRSRSEVCSELAGVKMELGRFGEADSLLDSAFASLGSLNDSLCYYSVLGELRQKRGDNEGVFECLEKENSILSELRKDEGRVFLMQSMGVEDQLEKAVARDGRHKRMLMASLVLLGLVFVGAILLYIYMVRKKRTEMGRQMTEIILLSRKLEGTVEDNASLSIKLATRQQNVDSLSSRLSSRENEIGGLVSELELNKAENVKLARLVDGLLRSRFSHLNAIISEYARQQESEDDYKIFYKNVAYELDKLRQPKSFQEIERMVDECKDGIIGKIRTQLPGLREKDVTFITLSIAGLSARAIGLFLGVHPNSTYKRRKQLIKYISESNAPDKDWFVGELDI